MAQKSKAQLYALFESGDLITEAALTDLIDSCHNGSSGVIDFDNELVITIPAASQLVEIWVWANVDQTVKIGDTGGGSPTGEYYDNVDVYSASIEIFEMSETSLTGKNIYLTGGLGLHAKYFIR